MIKVAIGQDSHEFEKNGSTKKLVMAGVEIGGCPGLKGNSDADVVLHALTNAVSGITGINILGAVSDEMCLNRGITDSSKYLSEALKYLKNDRVCHVSVSIEALRPKLSPHVEIMKESIASLMGVTKKQVGLTATTGEGLTEFGRGNGIFCTVILTVDVMEEQT